MPNAFAHVFFRNSYNMQNLFSRKCAVVGASQLRPTLELTFTRAIETYSYSQASLPIIIQYRDLDCAFSTRWHRTSTSFLWSNNEQCLSSPHTVREVNPSRQAVTQLCLDNVISFVRRSTSPSGWLFQVERSRSWMPNSRSSGC